MISHRCRIGLIDFDIGRGHVKNQKVLLFNYLLRITLVYFTFVVSVKFFFPFREFFKDRGKISI